MNIQKEFENRVKVCCEERVYANAAPASAVCCRKPAVMYRWDRPFYGPVQAGNGVPVYR